jgi:hypothetical protein
MIAFCRVVKDQRAALRPPLTERTMNLYVEFAPDAQPTIPEMVDPPSPSVLCCFSEAESKNLNNLVLIAPGAARDARGRFAKGSSGNLRGRPPGIRNPKRRIPDLVARPLGAQALAVLLDRKPHLLRPLAAQLMPPPIAPVDPMERLGIDLTSPPTPADLQRAFSAVFAAIARGRITPGEGLRIARAMRARLRVPRSARRPRGGG